MSHPSLVLWNGNNENIWGYVDWAWQPILDGRPWGAGFYFDLLPRIVAELDGTRPYWPGSPYSGTMAVAPNADAHGCVHEWEVWNRLDHARYRDRTPRFVSEFGWQAPPTWATLTAAISDSPLTADSPGMLHHQKAADGNDKLLPRPGASLRRARRHRRVAVGDPAQPGSRRADRRRALPLAARPVHGHHLVAAQRLLAGDELGRRRLRRRAQAGVARPAPTPTRRGSSPCSPGVTGSWPSPSTTPAMTGRST